MLAFAHIPTGTTANKGVDIEEVKSRINQPAIALTAIGADAEIGRGYTSGSGSGCTDLDFLWD
jgi:hypothetical protein